MVRGGPVADHSPIRKFVLMSETHVADLIAETLQVWRNQLTRELTPAADEILTMTGYDRILATLDGSPVDRLALMPITMMFAADQVAVPYGQYAADYRKLVEAQLRTAEKFDFDYVSCISDPGREAADCGATIHYFDNQPPAVDETKSLLADKSVLARLEAPDPLAGPRMYDRVQAAALMRQRVGREKLIEGWIEGPCAEAADLRGINRLMTDFFDDPDFVRDLFEFVLALGIEFARRKSTPGPT